MIIDGADPGSPAAGGLGDGVGARPVAGLVLTGGESRRMGRDKATIVAPDGQSLARRTARLLAAVADPVREVGPGHSGFTAVADGWPGAGPLAAVASGAAALRAAGWKGPVLVVATDLPGLTDGLLRWLAGYPEPGNVVPVVDGHPQLLCARYDAATLGRAPSLVGAGARRMRDLIEGRPTRWAGPEEWAGVGGSFRDVDTPAALAAFATTALAASGGGAALAASGGGAGLAASGGGAALAASGGGHGSSCP